MIFHLCADGAGRPAEGRGTAARERPVLQTRRELPEGDGRTFAWRLSHQGAHPLSAHEPEQVKQGE